MSELKKKIKNLSNYKVINELEKKLVKDYNKFLNEKIITNIIKKIKNEKSN